MSSIEKFISFTIEISNVDRDVQERLRLKLPRHVDEDSMQFYAKLLAYCHRYEKGMTILQDISNDLEPSFKHVDSIDHTCVWGEVGNFSRKRLQTAIHHHSKCKFAVYFYNDDQINSFCHALRGSSTNWVAEISFFQIDSELLEQLIALEERSARWNVVIVDGSDMYLGVNGSDYFLSFTPLDIWGRYQASINN